jgi:hypothetical protein
MSSQDLQTPAARGATSRTGSNPAPSERGRNHTPVVIPRRLVQLPTDIASDSGSEPVGRRRRRRSPIVLIPRRRPQPNLSTAIRTAVYDLNERDISFNNIIIPKDDVTGQGPIRRSHKHIEPAPQTSHASRQLQSQSCATSESEYDFEIVQQSLKVAGIPSRPAGPNALAALRAHIPSLANMTATFSVHSQPLAITRLRILLGY